MKTTIEVSEIQKKISELKSKADQYRDTGTLHYINQAGGIEEAIKSFGDLIKEDSE
jgi:hypothetical protein